MLDVMQEADLIRRVTKKVYWDSKFARLRTQLDEEDLIQMVFLKLLHRDNFKKYSDSFSLTGFLYRVANGCAISFATKAENFREWTILDKPTDEGEKRTLADLLVSDTPHIDLDTQYRLNRIISKMNSEINPRIVIRYNNEDRPFSIENMFRFFLETKFSRKEIMPHIINVKTNTVVTQSTFDKFWKRIDRVVKRELSA